eukprot:CAMPEP_0176242852 /NCGR_PEP_ID=MMETSP0121_2-20121125/30619_1 /TAXON_ID=160619 /ORGANISM="Kryptoperidinium foliaceum, Strain CCMP 1326" /LENGTH=252 /DNA_ID=CAMNT_0017582421 /DNA_START=107 /DNA_END=865 /DNA_ORIENTATION=+
MPSDDSGNHGSSTEDVVASVTSAVRARRSTRAFLRDKPVPLELIEDILDTARRAPSGGNCQPWHLYVTAGAARDALVAAFKQPGALPSAAPAEYKVYPPNDVAPPTYAARRRKVAYGMWELMGVDRKDTAARTTAALRNFDFFGAPVGIIVTVDRACDRNGWGHVGMLLQTICLLAQERGLATCMQEAWGNLGSVVYRALDIPSTEVIWCGLALGYADPSQRVNTLRTEREPLKAFVRFSGFPPAGATASKL